MKRVTESRIPGIFIMEPDIHEDIRGSLTKTYHAPTFDRISGIKEHNWGEIIISENKKKGVFRGLHFQKPPYAQAKTLCCISGSIINYSLDIRRGSPTYGRIECFNIDSDSKQVLYIPIGIANGYYTLEENTTILYNLTSEFDAESASGITWNSVGLDIKGAIVSDKDNELENWNGFVSPFTYSYKEGQK